MQCVKLRSVMGSYLNIHLNLFPIYVLLLLLTLSHGRPSAKVRETRGGELSKSQQRQLQQLRDKWYHLSNSNVNSVVSNEYDSVVYAGSQPPQHHLSHPKSEQQVDDNVDRRSISEEHMRNLVETSADATGSHRDAMKSGPLPLFTTTLTSATIHAEMGKAKEFASSDDGTLFPQQQPHHHLPTTLVLPERNAPVRGVGGDESPRPPQHLAAETHEAAGNSSSSSSDWLIIPNSSYTTITVFNDDGKPSYGEEEGSYDNIMSDQRSPQLRNFVDFHAAPQEEHQPVEILVEDDMESGQVLGSQQQLVTFRQNILRSLGHDEIALEVNYSPNNVSIDYNDEDALAKYNITKEEYLQAYTQYMINVKNRRQANRGLIGVKDRRKNAVTITKIYHDNGTDLFSIGSKVLKLLRFDVLTAPVMEETDVRIRRVVLTLPATCQLTGHLQDSTNPPDLRKLSELTLVEEDLFANDTESEEQVTHFDLTRNVTAWSVRSRTSSPFIVLAICSRVATAPVDAYRSPSARPHRPSHHHGSSLKIVTKEFMKPSPEAQIKRRTRRAAPTEPSTLRGFTHKRDSGRGRECANTRHGKTCCRRSLKIKFSDLGISDVILEPKEFDAHVCEGRCNARRVAYASTHAMFQHILHQTKGKKFAPRPCCVPTALTELDVLHLDPNGNRNGGPKLIVTILKDAIVKECGCS